MSKTIRDYMSEGISAFELDDALQRLSHDTVDGTVKFVRKEMWFHYDDCKDHKVVASKQQWDFFNRLLLLLESEAEVDFVRSRSSWRSEWLGFFRFLGNQKPSAAEIAITPFPSISSLLSLRRSVKKFARNRYPTRIAGRRIRNIVVQGILWIPWGMLLLTFSPIVLLIRMLRHGRLEPRIKMPGQ